MRKILLSVIAVTFQLAALAQTANIHVGNIVYRIPADKAGEMSYANGSTLTVIGKTLSTDEIDKIEIDNSTVTENLVEVDYDGNKATVAVPYNIMGLLTVKTDGAHVSIVQDESVADEITYSLSGASSDGSFYMDGELKATLILNGLTLNNPDSAAINIRDGKRIAVQLADGTTNTLTDGKNGSQKACFAVKGHTEFEGSGTLNITGNTAHAFWGKEYVQLKKGTGAINVLGAVGDGFNVNQYYQQNGGTVSISNVGDDGIQVSFKTDDNDNVISTDEDEDNTGEVLVKGGTLNITVTALGTKGIKAEGPITVNETKATATVTVRATGGTSVSGTDYTGSACIKSDKAITIDSGTLTLTATGQGGRALLSEGTLDINGGTISARAEGSNYGSSSGGGGGGGRPGGGGWGGWGGGSQSSSGKNAKGVKAEGAISITGGDINIYSASHEGLESKSTLSISGGTIYVKASDDAINSTSDMTISGGYVYAYATGNDGLDANGNMTIQGGVAIAFGGSGAETGIDIDEKHSLSIKGGQLFGIGGRTDSRYGTCTQSYGYTTSSVRCTSANGYFVLSQGTDRIFAVKVPTAYSGVVIVSSPSMVKNTTYSVASATSVGGEEINGFVANPSVSTVSNSVSLTGR